MPPRIALPLFPTVFPDPALLRKGPEAVSDFSHDRNRPL